MEHGQPLRAFSLMKTDSILAAINCQYLLSERWDSWTPDTCWNFSGLFLCRSYVCSHNAVSLYVQWSYHLRTVLFYCRNPLYLVFTIFPDPLPQDPWLLEGKWCNIYVPNIGQQSMSIITCTLTKCLSPYWSSSTVRRNFCGKVW